MKCIRIFFVTCLALIWGAAVWADAGAKQEETPVVIIQEKVHTFNEVLEGVDVRHDFIVQNKGAAVLKIEKVDST